MNSELLTLIGTIIAATIAAVAAVAVAKINRENKPVRDLLKNTKIQGDGSLVEALTILRQEYASSRKQFREDLDYYIKELKTAREYAKHLEFQLSACEVEISNLKIKLDDVEKRLKKLSFQK